MSWNRKSVSAYGVTLDEKGRRVEVEFRMCSHCQQSWQYQAGSGNKFGFCYYCNGLLCRYCTKIVWMRGDNRCVPYWEGAQELSKKYTLEPNLGIFVRK